MADTQTLGESIFNYEEYSEERFLHYFQQISHVLKLIPSIILEVGPGDHTVTDMLRRKGITVKTFDNEASLHPDYLGDIRQKLMISEKFDVVLASEILEHMKFEHVGKTLRHLSDVLKDDGYLIISLPYSTIRLFKKYGKTIRVFTCDGRILTGLPMYFLQPLVSLIHGFRRLIRGEASLFRAFTFYGIPQYPDDKLDVHHWDLGYSPTTRAILRPILQQQFVLLEEKVYVKTNCVFYVLRKARVA